MSAGAQPRAVVFGAGGLLGRALTEGLPASGVEVVGALRGRTEGDITDSKRVADLLFELRPDLIFNAAAYTNVDGAEAEPEAAFAANAFGPEVLARAASQVGAALVHYSTDFVFDGEQERPYHEADPPAPASVYARSKLEGERRVLAAWSRSYVLRVGCLYGRGGRNFPSTLLRRLRAAEVIRVDNERKVSPTWVEPVVRLSRQIAASEQYGLYHATAQGETTWADFAALLARSAGIQDAHLEGVAASSLRLPAARPRRAILVSRHLPAVGLEPLTLWSEQALAYLASEAADGIKV